MWVHAFCVRVSQSVALQDISIKTLILKVLCTVHRQKLFLISDKDDVILLLPSVGCLLCVYVWVRKVVFHSQGFSFTVVFLKFQPCSVCCVHFFIGFPYIEVHFNVTLTCHSWSVSIYTSQSEPPQELFPPSFIGSFFKYQQRQQKPNTVLNTMCLGKSVTGLGRLFFIPAVAWRV